MNKGIRTVKQGKGGRVGVNVDPIEVLTVVEASTLLRMKPEAIYNAIRNKVIPALKIGNRWRLSKEAILEALNVRK